MKTKKISKSVSIPAKNLIRVDAKANRVIDMIDNLHGRVMDGDINMNEICSYLNKIEEGITDIVEPIEDSMYEAVRITDKSL